MQFDHTAWKISAAALIIGCCSFYAYCLPEGENVVAGSASFDRSQADTLAVTTASDRLIVDYNSFNIAAQETVRFQQPGPQSIALNRVTGADPSAIFGTLTANGQIFLVNPNGILFASGSHVDVAGMVASTMDIANEDFLAGRYVFTRTGDPAYIINQGSLNAAGGYVCLLAQGVDNRAAIQADLGTVVLAAGEKVTLALEDANAISVVVDEAVSQEVFGPDGAKMRSAVSNGGTIQAAGGKVILTAKVLNKVFDQAINNTGLINVGSLVEHEGVVELLAEGAGIVNAVSGQIRADSTLATVQAGSVLLQADTILQQGLISANSLEDADAGSVTLISQSSTILDEASRT